MKIYQIHEYSGSYEDYRDHIVGTYLLEEKAKAEKDRLEAIETELEKCRQCPLYVCNDDYCLEKDNYCGDSCGETCRKHILAKINKYCDKYEDDGYEHCEKHTWYSDSRTYAIKEVEVIE